MTAVADATLRLFKALPVESGGAPATIPQMAAINANTIPKGYLVDPRVARGLLKGSAVDTIERLYGIDTSQLNNTFHKSLAKVRDASIEQLVIEQLVHYMTTYGAQNLGIFDDASVYVPNEVLDAPEIDVEGFSFVIIRGMTDEQIRSELMGLLGSGVALSEQSVVDATMIGVHLRLAGPEIAAVANREVQARLYDSLNIVPADPVEFLRYVTYRLTGTSLLIKNDAAVSALSEGAKQHATATAGLFDRYDRDFGLSRLGQVFYRFKPLLLALRSSAEMRPTINKIRRLAKTNHRPMKADYLNEVTATLSHGNLDVDRLDKELSGANVFRKIRLAQALAVRANPDLDSIVYKIRNGRSFATDFSPLDPQGRVVAEWLKVRVLKSVASDAVGSVFDKKVYIPEGVVYGLPATEKQFSGNLPAGSYIEAPEGQGLVAGVHWTDVDHHTVDLDLSLTSANGKIGWDGAYRTEDRSVLFSGDLTSAPAPKGATEVFWFGPEADGSWLVNLNHFNRYGLHDVDVPYKIVVGFDPSGVDRNYVIDPNNLLASIPTVMDTKQTIIGLAVADASTKKHRFYFSASHGGGWITAGRSVHSEKARRFMDKTLRSAPTLNEVLEMAGATMVGTASEADEGFDLSPSTIDKTTILSLLR